MATAKPLALAAKPDLYMILTSFHRPQPDIHLLLSQQIVCSLSRPLKKAYVTAVTHDRHIIFNDEKYICIKLDWWHRDSLIIILKAIHHHPEAFPDVNDMSFRVFWGIPATLDTLQIDLSAWFVRYFEHWKSRRLEYGYEPWLVVGKVFDYDEDYAKLSARIIVEFTGWKDGGGMLTGPKGTKGLETDGPLEMWEGWAPREVMGEVEKMKMEQYRLLYEILDAMDTWYRHIVHLKTSKQGSCTCSPIEDCVVVGKALITTLKSQGLIHRRHDHVAFRGSILELRRLLQPTEVKLRRALGGFGYGRCKVYDSMRKLLKDVDTILSKVRGFKYDGTVEEFNIDALCGVMMVLPWSTGQMGVVAVGVSLLLMVAITISWSVLKTLLSGACFLAKLI
ncbi:hypothetical protein H072_4253 [Dactylellina haptotyla CBS 200.50]|uniref:Uncharacterized protein n=1 Tax=Dactylellina haptotyla (strain CBS 200.50) TaxID=1284197 RepID=S8AFE0_DACHA|nr:hypothetical protein H072_4253 [Dactylellina haptotyla CBS 200.50]